MWLVAADASAGAPVADPDILVAFRTCCRGLGRRVRRMTVEAYAVRGHEAIDQRGLLAMAADALSFVRHEGVRLVASGTRVVGHWMERRRLRVA